MISCLSNDDYDILLSEHIVFVDLIELSACNTLLECIVRNTPILIKPLPPVVERLGSNYPLYWTEYDQIATLLTEDNIKRAHEYLSKLDKTCYTYWIESILKSNIFKSAQTMFYPIKEIDQIEENQELINSNMNLDEVKKTIEDVRTNIVEESFLKKLLRFLSCGCIR